MYQCTQRSRGVTTQTAMAAICRSYIIFFLIGTENIFLSLLMKILQLPGAEGYDTQMEIHT